MATELLTPLGIEADQPSPPLAPDQGRFFMELGDKAIPPEVLVPISSKGKPMSPVEASTGIPLPIVGPRGRTPNRHHAFFYADDYVRGTLGQRAVRLSRIQRVGRYVHESVFHKRFDGTAFPASESQEWEIAILSLAGYVPSFGVKFKKGQPYVEQLTVKEKKRLRRPDTIIQEKPSQEQGIISEFLLKYAYENNLGASEQLWVEEFLAIPADSPSEGELLRKLELAEKLTNRAIDVAVSPVNLVFSQARKLRKLKVDSQNCAWRVVKEKVAGRIPKDVGLLEDKLSQYFSS